MKRAIAGFMAGALIFGSIGVFAGNYVANTVDFKVMVNGKEFTSDPPPLEVEGRTYLPLRAIGDALGVPVGWNEELRQAEVGALQNDVELLKEVKNFYVSKIWNKGFCDISWYIAEGTNSSGGEMDINFAIEQLDKAMEEKLEYDKKIEQLDDEKYSDVKSTYKKLSDETDKLYQNIKNEPPVANNENTTFSTSLFTQYADAFYELVD